MLVSPRVATSTPIDTINTTSHKVTIRSYNHSFGFVVVSSVLQMYVYGNCNLRTILMVIVLSVDVFVVKKTASPLGHRLFCNFVILIL